MPAPHVTVISEAMAKVYFPNENPVGKHMAFAFPPDSPTDREIIGIVGNIRATSRWSQKSRADDVLFRSRAVAILGWRGGGKRAPLLFPADVDRRDSARRSPDGQRSAGHC